MNFFIRLETTYDMQIKRKFSLDIPIGEEDTQYEYIAVVNGKGYYRSKNVFSNGNFDADKFIMVFQSPDEANRWLEDNIPMSDWYKVTSEIEAKINFSIFEGKHEFLPMVDPKKCVQYSSEKHTSIDILKYHLSDDKNVMRQKDRNSWPSLEKVFQYFHFVGSNNSPLFAANLNRYKIEGFLGVYDESPKIESFKKELQIISQADIDAVIEHKGLKHREEFSVSEYIHRISEMYSDLHILFLHESDDML